MYQNLPSFHCHFNFILLHIRLYIGYFLINMDPTGGAETSSKVLRPEVSHAAIHILDQATYHYEWLQNFASQHRSTCLFLHLQQDSWSGIKWNDSKFGTVTVTLSVVGEKALPLRSVGRQTVVQIGLKWCQVTWNCNTHHYFHGSFQLVHQIQQHLHFLVSLKWIIISVINIPGVQAYTYTQ